MSRLLDFVLVPLSYGFMQRALLIAVLVGAVCAVLSCYLVLKGCDGDRHRRPQVGRRTPLRPAEMGTVPGRLRDGQDAIPTARRLTVHRATTHPSDRDD